MPRHHVGAILTFLNVSAVLCFLCSYDLFENQFVFLFECKYNTNNWFKSNISLFLRKKSRKRLRYLLLFLRTKQGNYSAPILSWVVTLILWVNVYYQQSLKWSTIFFYSFYQNNCNRLQLFTKPLSLLYEIGFIDYRSRFHISRLFYSIKVFNRGTVV